MSDVIFNVNEVWLSGESAYYLLTTFGVIYLLMMFSGSMSEDSALIFVVTNIVCVPVLIISGYCAFNAQSTVYEHDDSGVMPTKTKIITFDNFNETMKEKYHYDFKVQDNNYNDKDKSNVTMYTVTNMKTNKQYKNCTLDFKKINNNTVQLTDVTCGSSIMSNIVKNK